jgi:hypothetical protein
LIYIEATNQVKAYHVNTSTGTETELDIDPGNVSGDNKSRLQKVQALWHDRGNQLIWGVDCDNDGVSEIFYTWKLDYSVSETSPTVTEMDDKDHGNPTYIFDVFKVGGNVFALGWIEAIAQNTIFIYDIDTDPMVQKDTIVY